MKLPVEVELILDKLNNNGFSAYVVGGAVRDYLLGKAPYDYDITTSALPEEVIQIFSEYSIGRIEEAFGTVGVIINKKMYEITTFRKESEYENHRKPSKIDFINDLYFDLSRRDLTINAIAYNKDYVDYFGGIDDLNNHIIRTVGDPNLRFEEDGLRVLRTLRFSSNLGFEIEESTKKAIFDCYKYALCSSIPRRSIELKKIIGGKYFKDVIFTYNTVLKEFLEVFKYNDYYDFLGEGLFNNILIMYFKHQEILERDLKFLQLRKEDVVKIKEIYSCVKNIKFGKDISISKKINILIRSEDVGFILNNALNLLYFFRKIDHKQLVNYRMNISLALSRPYALKHLVVNGNDLLELGIENNKISLVLSNVLESVILRKIKNEKQDIIEYIKTKFFV